MSKEGPVSSIFKCRKVIKRPNSFENPHSGKLKGHTIITDTIHRRERYFNPITQKLLLRPTYLAALPKIKKKDEELQRSSTRYPKK